MMRADVAAVIAPIVALAEECCAHRRGITGLERQLAAGEAPPQTLAEWTALMEHFREQLQAIEARQRESVEGLRGIRADLMARGEWSGDEGIFAPCGCLILQRMCARCGLEALRGCAHNALCPSCATGVV